MIAFLILPLLWNYLRQLKFISPGTSGGVTTVACIAVITIPWNSLVFIVYLTLVIMCMTIDAAEHLVIAWICMAIGTKCPGTGMMS